MKSTGYFTDLYVNLGDACDIHRCYLITKERLAKLLDLQTPLKICNGIDGFPMTTPIIYFLLQFFFLSSK